jgi:Ca2+-transporting ATPase
MIEARGLSVAEAGARLAQFGHNDLVPERSSASFFSWIVRLVADPMVILLAIAGATYWFLGDRFDAIVVCIALLPIFLVTGILEYRSDRALEQLRMVSPPQACVIRDGVKHVIPARDVVPGDVLILREGDIVAADARVLSARRLLIDESALTGESFPVEKAAAQEKQALVLAGTIVRSGNAVTLVEETGRRTEYGRIGQAMSKMRQTRTPIERTIHRLVVQIGAGVALVCAIVVIIGHAHGDVWPVAIIAGISLAMAAIPEELPMVYTLYLALGAWRLAKDNALVRRLSSVETLGSTTVICVDKTGTLTHGKLAVESVFAARSFNRDDVLRAAALASDPDSGDPLDGALLAAAPGASQNLHRQLVVPFDPARQYAAAAWDGVLVVKGAYEALLARGAAADRQSAHAFLNEAAGRGARVLAIARAAIATPDERTAESLPLQLVGLVALADPVREAARDAVARCRQAGIRFVMITGDHPATAQAVAAQVGIDPQDVFARIRPEEKLRIVRELHAQGEVVAMTGDGTNDALALREADIGIAMGKSGTEVARAAASLILLDDNVTTIVRAVADGRRIFDNLRHAFSYLISFHAPLLLAAFLLPLLGAPILLYPIHLIWLEIIVHPTSALVFENDPAHADVMTNPPRAPSSALLRPQDWKRTLLLGLSLAGAVLALYLFLLNHGFAENAARAAALITMIVGQTTLVLVERAGARRIWRMSLRDNKAIAPILIGTLGTLVAAIFWAPLAHAFHLAAIPVTTALIAAAVGCLSVLWSQPLHARTSPVWHRRSS